MVTISLCMIVKNEEKVLDRCLESFNGIADEIIIADTGSEDCTKEIAQRYTDKIYDFQWIDDFAAARNFSFSKASMEYILWTDADDMLLEEDRQKFLQLKEVLNPTIDCVTMNINLAFDQYGKVTHTIRSNRLVKRSCSFRWVGPVHEYLEMGGNILNSDIGVTHKRVHHDVDRNIKIYEQRLKNNEEFGPRDLYYYANELLDHRRHQEAAEYYIKFLDAGKGWFEDNVAACWKLADIHIILNDWDNAMKYSLQSFKYDTPRAESCCRMGFLFLNINMYKQATFWYKLATLLEKPNENMGLTNSACWTWLPHLQLCVCYDRLGLYQLAYDHNELARLYIPDDQRVLYNKQYLENTLNIKNNGDQ
ncbi:glycosyltransferase family 2 protein [Geosporobacter ferrireducens]|uniref:Glycosyl transferase n=1 Tax=Geosporobacter ferrireducens TaxID=1424294 RepID=A0A1D8GEI8_9FIRM|nr:glycosyltransferase family 2 protein [Geosporobacter ferrireducens]AOT69339.1 glycosyl transferase [Geosporobacter ferrireducens]MTI57025.1 glycosyltransferase family 2 protein [Geosporobacter ferrireducens]